MDVKLIVCIFSVMISFSKGSCQLIDDIVDFDLQKDSLQIKKLLVQFLESSDPLTAKQYIYFPFFRTLGCDPWQEGLGAATDRIYFSDQEIQEIYEKDNCKYPFTISIYKFNTQPEFRDSLNNNKLTVYSAFYSSETNINALLSWIFKYYKFPKQNISQLKYNPTIITTRNVFLENNQKIFSEINVKLDRIIIGIIKIAGEYKISNVYRQWE